MSSHPTTLQTSNYQTLGATSFGMSVSDTTTPYMQTQIVPIDANLGYESLTHRAPMSSSTYFDINMAYPSCQNNTCTQFVLRKCDGRVSQKYITDSLPSPFPS